MGRRPCYPWLGPQRLRARSWLGLRGAAPLRRVHRHVDQRL